MFVVRSLITGKADYDCRKYWNGNWQKEENLAKQLNNLQNFRIKKWSF